MGDILSQNEIDELLQQLSSGEVDVKQIQTEKTERKIKEHDFNRPSKFAKDHIRTISIMYENYTRIITTYLQGYLRTLVQIEVVSVEALQYMEFTNSISNPAVLGIVDFNPLTGSIVFDMSPSIAYVIVEKILGGRGSAMEKIRAFTEIELAIIERVMTQLLNLMREPWENVAKINPRLESIEVNPQFAQIMSGNETIALVTMSIKVGGVEGFLNVCIPHMVIEPVISKLTTKLWFSMKEKGVSEDSKKNIENRIEETVVPLIGILGKANLSINEFLQLQPGDVIPLDTKVDGDLEVLVGDIHKFYAKPGVRNKKAALKVTDVVRREE